MTHYRCRDALAIAAAVAAPLAAASVLLPFRAAWPNPNVALLLVVVVVAVAALGNRVAGGLAALGAAAWFDFFFTVPYEGFTIRSTADITAFVLLLIVGIALSQLAAYARLLRVIAITDEGYLGQIQQATALAQTAVSPLALVDYVQEQLPGLLGLEKARFELGSLLSHPPRLETDGSLTAGQGRWDVEKAGLPAEFELWVAAGGQYYGRFLLTPLPGSGLRSRPGWSRSAWPAWPGGAFSAAEAARSTR